MRSLAHQVSSHNHLLGEASAFSFFPVWYHLQLILLDGLGTPNGVFIHCFVFKFSWNLQPNSCCPGLPQNVRLFFMNNLKLLFRYWLPSDLLLQCWNKLLGFQVFLLYFYCPVFGMLELWLFPGWLWLTKVSCIISRTYSITLIGDLGSDHRLLLLRCNGEANHWHILQSAKYLDNSVFVTDF